MRQRLTDRIAADAVEDKGTGIMNDPYQLNNPEHEKNDPKVAEYQKGDPEAWAEGVNKDSLWKKDKRNEMHMPEITAKMAAEAVQSARMVEERAYKCIVASQRILPGADDEAITRQATELLHLPSEYVDNLLSRQDELAKTIAKAASDVSKEAGEEEDEEDEEMKKKMEEAREKKAALEAELAEINKTLEASDSSEKEVGEEEDDDKEEKEAAKNEEEEKEEKEAASKESSDSLLDDIFSSVTASDKKQGAKSLSGMVKKQASESIDDLSKLWAAPPDVSKHF